MGFTSFFLIVGAVALAVVVIAIVVLVVGAVLTAWEYAKSPRAQMAEELEDEGTTEG